MVTATIRKLLLIIYRILLYIVHKEENSVVTFNRFLLPETMRIMAIEYILIIFPAD